MNIRRVEEKDAREILDIYSPFISHSAVSFETTVPGLQEFTERIISYTRKYPWIVAEKEGKILGYAYAGKHREREAYQWSVESSVYVHPGFYGQGIGHQLYSTLFTLLKQMGFVNVYAGVTLPNEKSIRLHRKMGFQDIGIYRKIGYKQGSWHDVLWMALTIHEQGANPAPPLGMENIAKA